MEEINDCNVEIAGKYNILKENTTMYIALLLGGKVKNMYCISNVTETSLFGLDHMKCFFKLFLSRMALQLNVLLKPH